MRTGPARLIAPLLLLAMAGYLYTFNLTPESLVGDDEGVNLYPAWRVSLGETLYRDVAFDHTPLAIYTGALLFRATGPSHLAAKKLNIGFILLAAFFAFLLGEVLFDRSTGMLALAFLVTNAYWHFYGWFYTSDAFYLCFYMASLYLFAAGWKGRGPKHLYFLSGLMGAFAIGAKLFGLFAFGGTFLFLLYRAVADSPETQSRRRAIAALVPLTCGALIGLLLLLAPMISYLDRFLALTVTHHRRSFQDLSPLWVYYAFFNVLYYEATPLGHRLLLLLGLMGIVGAGRKQEPLRALLVCHALQSLAFPFAGLEFYARHLLFLLPLLSIAAADQLMTLWKEVGEASRVASWLTGITLFTALLAFSSELPAMKHISVIDWIRSSTGEADTILTEYGEVAFLARRRNVPLPEVPASGNLPDKGIYRLDGATINTAIDRERPAVVVIRKMSPAADGDNHFLGQIKDEKLLLQHLESTHESVSTSETGLRNWLLFRRR